MKKIERCHHGVAWLLILSYVAVFTYLAFKKFSSFSYHDYDLAHNNQIIFNILRLKAYSSIIEMNFLGNHFQLIYYLVAPFYFLCQSPKTLLFIQSLFLGLAGWPLYLLARKELNNLYYAITLVIIYLLYPALGYANLFEFHSNAFLPVFLIFAFYFFIGGRFKAFLLFSILSLLCQENIALIIFMFGFLAPLKRRSLKWVITPFVLGGLWFLIPVKVIMPALNNGNVDFFILYRHLGGSLSGILKTMLLNPILILKQFLNIDKGMFLLQLFVPVSFLPLFSPSTLLLALPVFLQHFLSLRLSEHSIYYHYTLEIIPVIFIAAIYGIKNILAVKFIKARYIAASVFLVSIAIASNRIIGPQLHLPRYITAFRLKDIDSEKERLIRAIPKNAPTVATFEFLPKLSTRYNLHSFHFIYSGYYTLTNKKYEVPPDLEYALLNFNDPLTFEGFYSPHNYKNIRDFLAEGEWGAVEAVNNIVLFKKYYQGGIKLYEVLEPGHDSGREIIKLNDGINFLGCDIENKNIEKKQKIPLVFYWRCNGKIDADYKIAIQFLDKAGSVSYQDFILPCYGIYPTNAWKAGDLIKERHWILVPENLKEGVYALKVILFDRRNGNILSVFILPQKINLV